MVNSVNSIWADLSRIYSQNQSNLAEALNRIATGKRFAKPSDDYVAFLKANTLQSDIAQYQRLKEDISTAKALTDYGAQAGQYVFDQLGKLRDVATQASLATGAEQTTLQNKANAMADALQVYVNSMNYEGTDMMVDAGPAQLSTISVGVGSDPYTVTLDAASLVTSAELSGLDFTAAATAADVETLMAKVASYLATMEGSSSALQSHIDLMDTIIASKEASVSVATGINDVKELANLTDLQVRQDATIAMMSQANMARQGIARLYQ